MRLELFQNVRDSLVGHDWCTEEKAMTLAAMVLTLRPRKVVEIGVWTGASLVPMALAAKSLGSWTDPATHRPTHCTVIGIDPWDPVASAENQLPINAKWWSEAPHGWAHEQTVERVLRFGVHEHVELQRMTSDAFTPPPNIGLLHIDGNHGVQAIRDVHRYGLNVSPGGIVILDDFHWEGGAVEEAGAQLEGMGFRPMYDIDTVSFGRVFQRQGIRS